MRTRHPGSRAPKGRGHPGPREDELNLTRSRPMESSGRCSRSTRIAPAGMTGALHNRLSRRAAAAGGAHLVDAEGDGGLGGAEVGGLLGGGVDGAGRVAMRVRLTVVPSRMSIS